MRILNAIQNKYEWCMPLLLSMSENIFHLGIVICSCSGNHTLMMSGFRNLIQAILRNRSYICSRALYCLKNSGNGSIRNAFLYEKLFNGLSCTDYFQNFVSTLYLCRQNFFAILLFRCVVICVGVNLICLTFSKAI